MNELIQLMIEHPKVAGGIFGVLCISGSVWLLSSFAWALLAMGILAIVWAICSLIE